MTYLPKVYTASKIAHYTTWKRLRDDIGWCHVDFTARWIDMAHLEAPNAPPPTLADFGHFWTIDIQDVLRSDFVLLYAPDNDSLTLKGALVEAGAALASGKTVVTVGLFTNHSWSYHPRVVRLNFLEDARKFFFRYCISTTQSVKDARTYEDK